VQTYLVIILKMFQQFVAENEIMQMFYVYCFGIAIHERQFVNCLIKFILFLFWKWAKYCYQFFIFRMTLSKIRQHAW